MKKKLKKKMIRLEKVYKKLKKKGVLKKTYNKLKKLFTRPTPIYYAKKLSKKIGKCKIFFKREDLNMTNSHKINNAIGQIMIAKKIKAKKIIAETGAGQHGIAVATAAKIFDIKCKIFMGEKDYKKQKYNYKKMIKLKAKVKIIKKGNRDLNESIKEAIKEFKKKKSNFYLVGSVIGPHPYPMIVRDFQKIIGKECVKQKKIMKKNPNYVIACIGGGSNAIGTFYEYIKKRIKTKLIGVEAVGDNKKNSVIKNGKLEIIHGCKTLVLKKNGKIKKINSISSGLNYPSIGPEHCYLNEKKKAIYKQTSNKQAIYAREKLIENEGIIPSIESSHAIYQAIKIAKKNKEKKKIILVNLSGSGDKDI